MQMIEKLSLKLDVFPLGAILRCALGWLLGLTYSAFAQGRVPDWGILFLFMAVLLALRIVPLVARKILRFTSETLAIWEARRRISKYYDSYQWQKLFWIG